MLIPAMLSGLVNKNAPKQYPLDEILNDDERLVRGWASVEVKDTQGEMIPIADLRKTLNVWMDRGAFIPDMHTNRVIGKGLRWFEAIHPKTKANAIAIDYKIFKNYTLDDKVWEEIKSGKRKGLSFGGRATGKPEMKTDSYSGEEARELHGLETYEISSVDEPACSFAENFLINYKAKGAESDNSGKDALAITVFGKPYAELPDNQQKEIDSRVKEFIKLNEGKSNDYVASKAPERAIALKGIDVKNKVVKIMAVKKTKEEEAGKPESEENNEPATKQEPVAPPVAPPEAPQQSPELQLLGEIKQLLLQLAQGKVASAKQEEEEEPEPPKDEPEDEEKQEEESKPNPEGGEVILPKAPAGETDEDEPPKTDETRIMEKVNAIVDAKLKAVGVATTPRPKADVKKTGPAPKREEFALDLLEKVRKREIDQATMNRKIKGHVIDNYDRELKKFMATLKKEDV